ncbi:CLUMA_CG000500, isoform A [Clunio marinus]|uniref:CLUMA_CG000500, isoform A n=1 Tax=Clunio marinus TaxID=568069 RepID=A0A1J1HFA2_9DIPT|nr:CLUMA_CG000500, isoform A [Clunio marinus]
MRNTPINRIVLFSSFTILSRKSFTDAYNDITALMAYYALMLKVFLILKLSSVLSSQYTHWQNFSGMAQLK